MSWDAGTQCYMIIIVKRVGFIAKRVGFNIFANIMQIFANLMQRTQKL